MNRNKQAGAVLAITMIIMLVLTLLVVSTTQDVVTQEKMTAAIRDTNLSLAAAESAVTEAEQFIESQTTLAAFATTGNGLYEKDDESSDSDDGPSDLFDSVIWSSTNSVVAATTVAGVEARYFIVDSNIIAVPEEDLSGVNITGYGQTTGGGDVNAFKIVARATGKSGNAERVVVSYYGKRF